MARGPDTDGVAPTALAARIAEVVAIDPAAPAIEFEGRWSTWGALGSTIDAVAATVTSPGERIGIILRNRPAHVGCLLGVLSAGGCVVTINPQRGVERTSDEIARLGLEQHRRHHRRSRRNWSSRASAPAMIAVDDLGAAPVVTRPGHRSAARERSPAQTSRSRC